MIVTLAMLIGALLCCEAQFPGDTSYTESDTYSDTDTDTPAEDFIGGPSNGGALYRNLGNEKITCGVKDYGNQDNCKYHVVPEGWGVDEKTLHDGHTMAGAGHHFGSCFCDHHISKCIVERAPTSGGPIIYTDCLQETMTSGEVDGGEEIGKDWFRGPGLQSQPIFPQPQPPFPTYNGHIFNNNGNSHENRFVPQTPAPYFPTNIPMPPSTLPPFVPRTQPPFHAGHRIFVQSDEGRTRQPIACQGHQDCYKSIATIPASWAFMPRGARFHDKGCHCAVTQGPAGMQKSCIIERFNARNTLEYTYCQRAQFFQSDKQRAIHKIIAENSKKRK